MQSFLPGDPGSDFPLENLPWGVFSSAEEPGRRRIGVAIWDQVLDVTGLHDAGLLTGPQLSGRTCFSQVGNTLESLMVR